jgi:transcriptional regulator with XRE-family HTH domain
MKTQKSLLAQLKAARTEKGYSQERMAHECGMTMNNYARIERGDNGTTIATFERIANALGYRLTLEKL